MAWFSPCLLTEWLTASDYGTSLCVNGHSSNVRASGRYYTCLAQKDSNTQITHVFLAYIDQTRTTGVKQRSRRVLC